MSASSRLRVLHADLGKALAQLGEIERYYEQFRADYPERGVLHDYDLVILADLLADYYTCIETAFVRVAKQFENDLDREKWHKGLLERMTIDVPGIRRRVISDDTYRALDEIMRFRHLKRNYVERKYSRERMRLLEEAFTGSLALVRGDLLGFQGFVQELIGRIE